MEKQATIQRSESLGKKFCFLMFAKEKGCWTLLLIEKCNGTIIWIAMIEKLIWVVSWADAILGP